MDFLSGSETMLTKNTQKAFTLVELMIVISLVAIILGYGIPRFKQVMANNQSLALGEDIAGALQYARTEAVKQAKMITFCPANDEGTGCATDTWSGRGWLVVRDTAASETATAPVVATDAILKRWDKLKSSGRMTLDNDRMFVRFTGMGMLARVEGTNPVTITSHATECTGSSARTININLSGMISVVKADC